MFCGQTRFRNVHKAGHAKGTTPVCGRYRLFALAASYASSSTSMTASGVSS